MGLHIRFVSRRHTAGLGEPVYGRPNFVVGVLRSARTEVDRSTEVLIERARTVAEIRS
jgi:hypothetical protein